MEWTDHSIIGLLLQCHARVAGQSHGDEFLHHNQKSKVYWDSALEAIESAIRHVNNAELMQQIEDARKPLTKKVEDAG
jgi:hypothetical protein